MKRTDSEQKRNSSRRFNLYEMNEPYNDFSDRSKTGGNENSSHTSKKYDTRTLRNLIERVNSNDENERSKKNSTVRKKKSTARKTVDVLHARKKNVPDKKRRAASFTIAPVISGLKNKTKDMLSGSANERKNLSDTRALKDLAVRVARKQKHQSNENSRLYETRALYSLKSINAGGKRKHSGKKRFRKVAAIISVVLLVLIIAGVVSYGFMFGGMKRTSLDDTDLGIDAQHFEGVDVGKIEGIMNIALFGIDTTEGAATIGDQYRSDCIIILSVDPDDNDFKVTSILRDSKVPIEGYSPQKINAAYKYGGAKLAIKTLNQNFKMNIKDYVTVDFARMAEIIDMVGGLTIKITAAEAQNMMDNNIIDPVREGTWLLDGAQCVAYARVRKVDSDYFRASRQQHVLTLLFNKIKKMPKSDYPSLISSLLKCVETSMSYSDILKIVNSMDLSKAELVTNTIPDPQYEKRLAGGVDSTGSWVWEYDLEAASARLHNIIYGTPYDPSMFDVPSSTIGADLDIPENNASNTDEQIQNFFENGEVESYDPAWEDDSTYTETYEEYTEYTEQVDTSTEEYVTDEGTGSGDEAGDGEVGTDEQITSEGTDDQVVPAEEDNGGEAEAEQQEAVPKVPVDEQSNNEESAGDIAAETE